MVLYDDRISLFIKYVKQIVSVTSESNYNNAKTQYHSFVWL